MYAVFRFQEQQVVLLATFVYERLFASLHNELVLFVQAQGEGLAYQGAGTSFALLAVYRTLARCGIPSVRTDVVFLTECEVYTYILVINCFRVEEDN